MDRVKKILCKNGVKIGIRELTSKDKHKILDFYRNISDKIRISFFEGYRSFESWRTKKFGDSMIYTDGLDINNKNSWSIIALKGCGDDENIIGDIRAYKNKNDDWVEISLIVKKGFRGIGIGSKLLEFMIKKLKKYGLKGIFCYIDEKNTIMINLINKFGFSRSPSDNNLYTKIIN